MWNTLRRAVSLGPGDSLSLRDVPPLPRAQLPSARLASLCAGGGLVRLRECLREGMLPTLWFFAVHGRHHLLPNALFFLVSSLSLGAVPLLVERLLHALEAPAPDAPLCWALVGGLAASYVAYAASTPASDCYAIMWTQSTEAALLALAASKAMLLSGEREEKLQKLLAGVAGRQGVVAFTELLKYDSLGSTLGVLVATALAATSLVSLLGLPTTAIALSTVAALTWVCALLRKRMKEKSRGANKKNAERVRLLGEALPRLLQLRGMGWLGFVQGRLLRVREEELGMIREGMMGRLFFDVVSGLSRPIVILVTFCAYGLLHGGALPSPAAVFSAVTWLVYLEAPVVNRFGRLLQNWQTAVQGMENMRELLQQKDADLAHAEGWSGSGKTAPSGAFGCLLQSLANVTVSCKEGSGGGGGSDCLLSIRCSPEPHGPGLEVTVESGKLILLLGPAGSGKTALLRHCVGDDVFSGAALRVPAARVVYVPRDPWLQKGGARSCVAGLFAAVWRGGGGAAEEEDASAQVGRVSLLAVADDKWCLKVLSACGLDEDKLPVGAAEASGGQRARLALARAVYSGARHGAPPALFLLDNVFADLDTETAQLVWKRCVKELILERGHGALLASSAPPLWLARSRAVSKVALLGPACGGGGVGAEAPAGAPPPLAPLRRIGQLYTVTRVESSREGKQQLLNTYGLGASPGASPGETPFPAPPPPCAPTAEGGAQPQLPQQQQPMHAADPVTAPSRASFLEYQRELPQKLVILAFFLFGQAVATSQSFWLEAWVKPPLPAWAPSGGAAPAGVYGLLTVLFTLSVLARVHLLNNAALAAARALHERALKGVFRAPAARLEGWLTGSGMLLTRFGKSVEDVDVNMRWTSLTLLNTSFSMLGTVAALALKSQSLLLLGGVAALALLFLYAGAGYRRVVLALNGFEGSLDSGLTGLWKEACAREAAGMVRGGGPACAAKMVAALLAAQVPPLRAEAAAVTGASIADSALYMVSATVMISVAAVALQLVVTGHLPPSGAGLLLSVAFTFPEDVRNLISTSSSFESALISVRKVAELGALKGEDDVALLPEVAAAPRAAEAPPALSLHQVKLRYRKDSLAMGAPCEDATAFAGPRRCWGAPADVDLEAPLLSGDYDEEPPLPVWQLNGFSVDVPEGAKVAVTGESGCGKSSLFSALLRLWPHEEGAIRVRGEALGPAVAAEAARARFAYLPQHGLTLSGSVRENLTGALAPPPGGSRWAVYGTWSDAALEQFCAQVSPSLGRLVEKKLDATPSNWGKGHTALLSVARLLLAQEVAGAQAPPVLLLDEPGADLDADGAAALCEALSQRPEAALTIVHSRKAADLKCFKYQLVVRDGKVAYFGPPEHLLSQRAAGGGAEAKRAYADFLVHFSTGSDGGGLADRLKRAAALRSSAGDAEGAAEITRAASEAEQAQREDAERERERLARIEEEEA